MERRAWRLCLQGFVKRRINNNQKERIKMKLTYGEGCLQTQQGVTGDGLKCLTITKRATPMPINSTPAEWEKQVDESRIDVVLAFKNIESARTLQDELNELIAVWSKQPPTPSENVQDGLGDVKVFTHYVGCPSYEGKPVCTCGSHRAAYRQAH